MQPRLVKTADHRRLAVQTFGDPEGRPVFLMHGTPGSRLGPIPRSTVLYNLGVHLISFDRPGYGGSDRLIGRQVAAAAVDVQTIADELGLDRFAVVGRSGGGPHALACGALLAERVHRVAALVSLAPGTPRAWTGTAGWRPPTTATTGPPSATTSGSPPPWRSGPAGSGTTRTPCWPACAANCPAPTGRWSRTPGSAGCC